jgi:hypothetical protein
LNAARHVLRFAAALTRRRIHSTIASLIRESPMNSDTTIYALPMRALVRVSSGVRPWRFGVIASPH